MITSEGASTTITTAGVNIGVGSSAFGVTRIDRELEGADSAAAAVQSCLTGKTKFVVDLELTSSKTATEDDEVMSLEENVQVVATVVGDNVDGPQRTIITTAGHGIDSSAVESTIAEIEGVVLVATGVEFSGLGLT